MSRRSRNKNKPSSLVPRAGEIAPFDPRGRAHPLEPFEVVEQAEYPIEDDPEVGFINPATGGITRTRISTSDEVEVNFETSVRSISVERPPGYWKMRSGRFVAIRDMDDTHLGNCIRMCERSSLNRGRRPFPNPGSSYAELLEERSRRTAVAQIQEFARARENMAIEIRNGLAERLRANGIEPTAAAMNLYERMTGAPVPVPDNAVPVANRFFAQPDVAIYQVTDRGLQRIGEDEIVPQETPTALPEGAPKRRIRT